MDPCLASNQIGNFAPSGGGGGGSSTVIFADPLVVKNIDCVSLETDTCKCGTLTVNGQAINSTQIQQVVDKTANQTATQIPAVTDFSGKLTVDDFTVAGGSLTALTVNTDTIQPYTPGSTVQINAPVSITGNLTVGNALSVNNTSATTGATLAQFYQSKLGDTTPATTQSCSMFMGKSSSQGESAQIKYTRDTTASNNNVSISLAGFTGPQIYSSFTNIPNELRVSNYTLLPRINAPLVTLPLTDVASTTILTSIPSTVKRIVIMAYRVRKTPPTDLTKYRPPMLQFTGTSSSIANYEGLTWGNNAANAVPWVNTAASPWFSIGIPLWNNPTYPTDPSGSARYFDYRITLDYMGLYNGFSMWNVTGSSNELSIGSTNAAEYYAYFSGNFNLSTAGSTLNSIVIQRNSDPTAASNFAAGTFGVLYY